MVLDRLKTDRSRLNLKEAWRGLFTTEYSSTDEKYFVTLAMERRRRVSGDLAIRLSVIYNIMVPLFAQFVADPKVLPYITGFHLLHLAATLPMFIPYFAFKPIIERVGRDYVLPVSILLPPVFYALMAYFIAPTFPEPRHILLINHIYMVSILIVLVHPGSRWQRAVSVVFLSAVSFLAFYQHPVGSALTLFSSFTMLIAFLNTVWTENQMRSLARHEFALMIQAAPAKIVRQTSRSNDDLSKVFAPTHRHCVCISSDWRGYQAISASMSSEQLAAALGAYYEMVDRLLAKTFLDGNYYSDWIADELFVVVFAKDTEEEKVLINAALSFASHLVIKKQEFGAANGLEISIDIGVSSGVSLIGMMGPPAHRKATALGDVPGQARRFQMAGKQLRMRFGDTDRVIFGSNSLMQITEPFAVRQFDLDSDEKIRDLSDRALFYMEPLMSAARQAI